MSRHIIISTIVVAFAFMILAPAVMAQQGRGNFTPPTPAERVQQLEQAITLTADQRTKILAIYSDTSGGGRGMRGFGMMGGQLPENIQAVLTADQIKQYDAYVLKQQVDQRMAMIEQNVTGITADQRAKIAPVLEKEITGQTELFAGMRDGGGMGGDFQGIRDKMQALTDATTASLKSILTAQQMTQYSAMPQGRGFGGGRMGGGGMGGGMRGN